MGTDPAVTRAITDPVRVGRVARRTADAVSAAGMRRTVTRTGAGQAALAIATTPRVTTMWLRDTATAREGARTTTATAKGMGTTTAK